jgi:hypothetical protein
MGWGGQEGFAAKAFVYSHFYRRQPPTFPPYQGGSLYLKRSDQE